MTDEMAECSECSRLLDWVVDYLDGSADAAVRQEIELHAQSCEHCARLLWSLKRIVSYCQTETCCEMPLTVHRRLWEVIVQELRTSQDPEEA